MLEPKVNVNGYQIGPMLLQIGPMLLQIGIVLYCIDSLFSVKGPMLLGDGVNLLSKWLLKPFIFSPTLSVQRKNLKKNIFNKSSCGACIWDTKIEMERLSNNACC